MDVILTDNPITPDNPEEYTPSKSPVNDKATNKYSMIAKKNNLYIKTEGNQNSPNLIKKQLKGAPFNKEVIIKKKLIKNASNKDNVKDNLKDSIPEGMTTVKEKLGTEAAAPMTNNESNNNENKVRVITEVRISSNQLK